ncbi:MAG: 2-oxoacid:acceptor oxidoreductase subunit alpha [Elusimicrobia bacterium]|nr:2-oxoacid:acceptor oxidoreductase subunit alpha [Elusimicrobiota bacterium]
MNKPSKKIKVEKKSAAVIKFAGDSGDGIQVLGSQFANATAVDGRDLSTLPDYPAEIRAPAGSLGGVSGFQIAFGDDSVMTPGNKAEVLVAMNPAALAVNLKSIDKGSLIIANGDAFTADACKKAGYENNPLEDGSLSNYRIISVPANSMVQETLKDSGLTAPQILKCKNFFMLGVIYWIYDLKIENTVKWLEKKFSKMPAVLEANKKVLFAGYNYAENTEIFDSRFNIEKSKPAKGKYKNLTGNEASAYGLMAAAKKLGRKLFYGSYPITPASEILQTLAKYRSKDITVFQAEDEIAAICSSIGAAFAGNLAATGTSGPGLSLKSEALGLAVITELPLVIIDVQRGGPSTGLPTKTEQSDLFQALFGRHGDCPLVVMAAQSPADCFHTVYEASRISVKYMTPVIVLTSAYIANGSEPFKIPSENELKNFELMPLPQPDKFQPYLRDSKTLSRPWAYPGLKGYEHRIGGLEKSGETGHISYDPENHQKMTDIRREKIKRIVSEIAPLEINGDKKGDLLVLSWGSAYGAANTAAKEAQKEGLKVSSVNLKFLNPLPGDLGEKLKGFKKILIPEENDGQLAYVIRAEYLMAPISLKKSKGQPLNSEEILKAIKENI